MSYLIVIDGSKQKINVDTSKQPIGFSSGAYTILSPSSVAQDFSLAASNLTVTNLSTIKCHFSFLGTAREDGEFCVTLPGTMGATAGLALESADFVLSYIRDASEISDGLVSVICY